jgi:hypothetical protein
MPTPTPAESARAAAAAAARAADAYEQAKELDAIATSIEEDAARLAATGSPLDAISAEQFREEAGAVRASAAAHTRQAEQAERVAREELERAAQHEDSVEAVPAPTAADEQIDAVPPIDGGEVPDDFAADEPIPTDAGPEPAFEFEA